MPAWYGALPRRRDTLTIQRVTSLRQRWLRATRLLAHAMEPLTLSFPGSIPTTSICQRYVCTEVAIRLGEVWECGRLNGGEVPGLAQTPLALSSPALWDVPRCQQALVELGLGVLYCQGVCFPPACVPVGRAVCVCVTQELHGGALLGDPPIPSILSAGVKWAIPAATPLTPLATPLLASPFPPYLG